MGHTVALWQAVTLGGGRHTLPCSAMRSSRLALHCQFWALQANFACLRDRFVKGQSPKHRKPRFAFAEAVCLRETGTIFEASCSGQGAAQVGIAASGAFGADSSGAAQPARATLLQSQRLRTGRHATVRCFHKKQLDGRV